MKRIAVLVALLPLGVCSCGHTGPTSGLTHEELLDPETCKTCHPVQFADWKRSMHAYASDDPVFVAMNKRGQREAGVKEFCVKCHAPLAFQLGLTQDGLNLDSLPKSMHGVTCYFCHSIDSVTDTHNAGVHLAKDDVLRGDFADPVEGTPHKSVYSSMHDGKNVADASKLCGSCHDIVTTKGAPIERTFLEWQKTLFAKDTSGNSISCTKCHMKPTPDEVAQLPPDLAKTIKVKQRTRHDHDFPAVDVALTPWPEQDVLEAKVKEKLDLETLMAELCVEVPPNPRIWVMLDNFGPGHSFPSGATQDRRAWVELKAYKNGNIIYQTGVVPDGTPVEAVTNDPELWLMRDCMFDENNQPVDMFWQAASVADPLHNLVPASPVLMGPGTLLSHVPFRYANNVGGGVGLPELPDRVTMKVHLQPIGPAVLDDLVKSGDLDASIPPKVPSYVLASTELVWTATSATDSRTTLPAFVTCVATLNNPTILMTPIEHDPQTVSHLKCQK